MAGRKPTPTRLKVLTGNPGKRPVNKNEPDPPRGIAEMPAWLREFPVAVEEWIRESEILDGMGVLTIADSGLFAMRCYLAAMIQAESKENTEGVKHLKLITEYRQIGSLFGLDPAARSKLSINPDEKKKNKFEGLLRNASQK